ncbi:hypothetical protein REPUB_Repub13aG0036300 [Reevesia pubescens]
MEGPGLTPKSVIHQSFWATKEESENDWRSHEDYLSEGFVSTLPEVVLLEWRQNDLTALSEIWNQWGSRKQEAFTEKYGDLALLLRVKVDEGLVGVVVQFWDPSYRCFSFGKEDMTPTIEEYSTLLRIQPKDKSMVYWKEPKKSKYQNRVSRILGIDGNNIEGSVKGESHGIPWNLLKPHIMGDSNEEQSIELFALAIYGLVVFPKVLGHIEISVIDFFGQVSGKKIDPAPSIVAETIRTLNFCKRKGKGRLLACTQLLYIWVQSHFWGAQKVLICPYSGTCIPIKEFLKKEWP